MIKIENISKSFNERLQDRLSRIRIKAAPSTRKVATVLVPKLSKMLKASAAPKYCETAATINKTSGEAESVNPFCMPLEFLASTR